MNEPRRLSEILSAKAKLERFEDATPQPMPMHWTQGREKWDGLSPEWQAYAIESQARMFPTVADKKIKDDEDFERREFEETLKF